MTKIQKEINIPRYCFKYPIGIEQIQSEGLLYPNVEELNSEGEITLTIKGCNFKWKGYSDSETMFAVNQVKAVFIENIKLLTRKQFIFGTLYTFISKKEIQFFIDSFNRQTFKIISPYILKYEHLSVFARELNDCIVDFMVGLGLTEESSQTFAEVFSHIIEYDNAYRFRLLDILSETTQNELKTPRKAILRLIELVKDRDNKIVSDKYIKIARLISLALLFPKVKKAFKFMVFHMQIENLQWDDSDLYWSCETKGYKFRGQDSYLRNRFAKTMGWNYPERNV